jgi:replicative DNA helicase
MLQQLPAQNIEAEQAVLGCMMLEHSCIAGIRNILDVQDFYRITHQAMFGVIGKLYDAGEPIDIISVNAECRKNKTLQDMESEYVFTLAESVPTAANAESYARRVKTESKRRKQQELGRLLTVAASMPDSDPDGISEILVRELSDIGASQPSGEIDAYKMLDSYWERYEKRSVTNDTKLYTSGFSKMDSMFGKLGEAQFIILKGRRGSGKTHAMINFSVKCAAHKRTAVIFSYEMSKYQLLDRYIANITGTDSQALRVVTTDSATAISKAAVQLSEYSIKLFESGGMSVSAIRMACHALINQGCDIGFIGLDFIELVSGSRSHNREQELGQVARELKDLATEIDTTIVALSQVNKEGAERGSEGIGNLADLLLHWMQDTDGNKKIGILAAEKNRFGPGFTINCGIDLRVSNIWEIQQATDHSGG